MVLTPREVFGNSRDHSVLIIDNFRGEVAFWNGSILSPVSELDFKRVFSLLKSQSQQVCRGLIGKQYVHDKFDNIDESSLLILVFDNSIVIDLRNVKKSLPQLRGFTACKVNQSRVTIDLVCGSETSPKLGSKLIWYILRYADKYKKLNVHLEAATIGLACKFYPIFGFKFTKKEKKHEERCKEDGTVDSSELDVSKMFKMLRTIKRNTMSQSQRSRSVASRTRAANTKRRASEYRTPGTRRSSRLKTVVTKRTSRSSRLSNIPE
jgi:hypothetical protein